MNYVRAIAIRASRISGPMATIVLPHFRFRRLGRSVKLPHFFSASWNRQSENAG
jgi:hypothetical protein